MAISVEALAARLDVEAKRRGVDPMMLLDRLLAQLDADPLEAFIGVGESGSREPLDMRAVRRPVAENKFADGI